MTAEKYRMFKRCMALVLIVALTVTSLPAYAGSAREITSPLNPRSNKANLNIPAEFGTVSERYRSGHGKTIIYLEDAHDSLEAQENIAKLIDLLVNKLDVKTVFEEGYEGPVPTDDYFKSVSDPKIREKVSYFLLDKLRIGGAEYAHINRKKDFKLIGADNIKLHLENVDWYRKAAEDKETTEKDLAALRFHIGNLANLYFPEELKDWMKFKEQSDRGEIDLVVYLDRARAVFVQKIGAEAFQQKYPHIELLRFARNTDDPEIYEQVKSVKPVSLFEEIDRMENDFSRAFLKNARDQKIFDYYKGIALIKRLSNIEINSDEFEAVKDTLVKLKTEPLAYFIVDQTGKSVVLSKRWETHIQNAIEYYETSRERDDVIKREFTDFLTSSNEDTAVLVFGGFHKSRIREIFRQTGVSYLIVTPKITELNPKHRDYYKQLMSVGHYSFEVPFQVRTGSRPPSILEAGPDFGRNFITALGGAISPTTDLRNPISMRQLERQLEESMPATGFGAARKSSKEIRISDVVEKKFPKSTLRLDSLDDPYLKGRNLWEAFRIPGALILTDLSRQQGYAQLAKFMVDVFTGKILSEEGFRFDVHPGRIQDALKEAIKNAVVWSGAWSDPNKIVVSHWRLSVQLLSFYVDVMDEGKTGFSYSDYGPVENVPDWLAGERGGFQRFIKPFFEGVHLLSDPSGGVIGKAVRLKFAIAALNARTRKLSKAELSGFGHDLENKIRPELSLLADRNWNGEKQSRWVYLGEITLRQEAVSRGGERKRIVIGRETRFPEGAMLYPHERFSLELYFITPSRLNSKLPFGFLRAASVTLMRDAGEGGWRIDQFFPVGIPRLPRVHRKYSGAGVARLALSYIANALEENGEYMLFGDSPMFGPVRTFLGTFARSILMSNGKNQWMDPAAVTGFYDESNVGAVTLQIGRYKNTGTFHLRHLDNNHYAVSSVVSSKQIHLNPGDALTINFPEGRVREIVRQNGVRILYANNLRIQRLERLVSVSSKLPGEMNAVFSVSPTGFGAQIGQKQPLGMLFTAYALFKILQFNEFNKYSSAFFSVAAVGVMFVGYQLAKRSLSPKNKVKEERKRPKASGFGAVDKVQRKLDKLFNAGKFTGVQFDTSLGRWVNKPFEEDADGKIVNGITLDGKKMDSINRALSILTEDAKKFFTSHADAEIVFIEGYDDLDFTAPFNDGRVSKIGVPVPTVFFDFDILESPLDFVKHLELQTRTFPRAMERAPPDLSEKLAHKDFLQKFRVEFERIVEEIRNEIRDKPVDVEQSLSVYRTGVSKASFQESVFALLARKDVSEIKFRSLPKALEEMTVISGDGNHKGHGRVMSFISNHALYFIALAGDRKLNNKTRAALFDLLAASMSALLIQDWQKTIAADNLLAEIFRIIHHSKHVFLKVAALRTFEAILSFTWNVKPFSMKENITEREKNILSTLEKIIRDEDENSSLRAEAVIMLRNIASRDAGGRDETKLREIIDDESQSPALRAQTLIMLHKIRDEGILGGAELLAELADLMQSFALERKDPYLNRAGLFGLEYLWFAPRPGSPRAPERFNELIERYIFDSKAVAADDVRQTGLYWVGEGVRNELRENLPALSEIMADPAKLARLLTFLSVMRLAYPYHQINGEYIDPISWAEKNKTYFEFRGLRIAPVSESFRRHIIYTPDRRYAIEIKFPGERRSSGDVDRLHITLAEKLRQEEKENPGVVEPLFHIGLKGDFYLYRPSYEPYSYAEFPLGVAAFRYTAGKRLSNVLSSDDAWNAFLKEAYGENPSPSLAYERITVDVLKHALYMHRLGYQASRDRGRLTDLHLENFRLLPNGRVISVGDFGIYRYYGSRLPMERRAKETSSLLNAFYNQARKRSWLIPNIGILPFTELLKFLDMTVCEMLKDITDPGERARLIEESISEIEELRKWFGADPFYLEAYRQAWKIYPSTEPLPPYGSRGKSLRHPFEVREKISDRIVVQKIIQEATEKRRVERYAYDAGTGQWRLTRGALTENESSSLVAGKESERLNQIFSLLPQAARKSFLDDHEAQLYFVPNLHEKFRKMKGVPDNASLVETFHFDLEKPHYYFDGDLLTDAIELAGTMNNAFQLRMNIRSRLEGAPASQIRIAELTLEERHKQLLHSLKRSFRVDIGSPVARQLFLDDVEERAQAIFKKRFNTHGLALRALAGVLNDEKHPRYRRIVKFFTSHQTNIDTLILINPESDPDLLLGSIEIYRKLHQIKREHISFILGPLGGAEALRRVFFRYENPELRLAILAFLEEVFAKNDEVADKEDNEGARKNNAIMTPSVWTILLDLIRQGDTIDAKVMELGRNLAFFSVPASFAYSTEGKARRRFFEYEPGTPISIEDLVAAVKSIEGGSSTGIGRQILSVERLLKQENLDSAKPSAAGFGAAVGGDKPNRIRIKQLLDRLEQIEKAVKDHPTLPKDRWKELMTELRKVWIPLRGEAYFEAAQRLNKLVHDPAVLHYQESYLSRRSIRTLAVDIERASVPEELLLWFRKIRDKLPEENEDRHKVLQGLMEKLYKVDLNDVMTEIEKASDDEIKQIPNRPIFTEAVLEWRKKKRLDHLFYRYTNIYPEEWFKGKMPSLDLSLGMSRHFGPTAWALFINHFAQKVAAQKNHRNHRNSGFGVDDHWLPFKRDNGDVLKLAALKHPALPEMRLTSQGQYEVRQIKGRRMSDWLREESGKLSDDEFLKKLTHWMIVISDAMVLVEQAGLFHGDLIMRNIIIEENTDKPFIVDFFHPIGGYGKDERWALSHMISNALGFRLQYINSNGDMTGPNAYILDHNQIQQRKAQQFPEVMEIIEGAHRPGSISEFHDALQAYYKRRWPASQTDAQLVFQFAPLSGFGAEDEQDQTSAGESAVDYENEIQKLVDEITEFHKNWRNRFKEQLAAEAFDHNDDDSESLTPYEQIERKEILEEHVMFHFDSILVRSSADEHFKIAALRQREVIAENVDEFYLSLLFDYQSGWLATMVLDRLDKELAESADESDRAAILRKIIDYLSPDYENNVMSEAFYRAGQNLPNDFNRSHVGRALDHILVKERWDELAKVQSNIIQKRFEEEGPSEEFFNEIIQVLELRRDFLIDRAEFLMKLLITYGFSGIVASAFDRFEVAVEVAAARKQKPPYLAGFGTEDTVQIQKALAEGQFKEAGEKMRAALDEFAATEKVLKAGTDHGQLVRLLSIFIDHIDSASEEGLAFIEKFFIDLRTENTLRVAAISELAFALIKRRRSGEIGGRSDIEFIRKANALLNHQLLAGRERLRLAAELANTRNGSNHRVNGDILKNTPGVVDIFERIRLLILLKGDITKFPAHRGRSVLQTVPSKESIELSRIIHRDMSGADILRMDKGRFVLAQYHQDYAVTRPYFAVVIDKTGIPIRIVMKDKRKRSLKDHASHLAGNSLFSAIHAPTAWVSEGEHYVYIREIKGMDMLDLLSGLHSRRDEREFLKRLFFALGVAMSEAHILGAEDRPHNLSVSIEKLEQFSTDDLLAVHRRAVINIDRENVLTPRYLNKPMVDDIEEARDAFLGWASFSLPQDKRIFEENLPNYLEGFRAGYRSQTAYFAAHSKEVTGKIKPFAGDFSESILTRLNAGDDEIGELVNYLSSQIRAKLTGFGVQETAVQLSGESEVRMELMKRLAKEGKITFRDFMDITQYHVTEDGRGAGYYSSGAVRIGSHDHAEKHFMTYPEEKPELFGRTIAKQISQMWEILDKPSIFHIVEMGAGNGTMAKNILTSLKSEGPEGLIDSIRYVIIEISPELTNRQKQTLSGEALPITWIQASALDIPLKDIDGVFISNELPDAFPVHWVRKVGGQLKEVYITAPHSEDSTGRFTETIDTPSSEEVVRYVDLFKRVMDRRFTKSLLDGPGLTVNLDSVRWQESMARSLRRGYVITIDYGSKASKPDWYSYERSSRASVRTFGEKGREGDLFVSVGEVDITTDVHARMLAEHGAAAGLEFLGVTSQYQFFRNIGFTANDDSARFLKNSNFFAMIQGKNVPKANLLGLSASPEKVSAGVAGKTELSGKAFDLKLLRKTPAFDLLEAFGLADLKKISGAKILQIKAGPNGSTVRRIQVPAERNARLSHKSLNVLYPTAGGDSKFDLLFNPNGLLVAIFPVVSKDAAQEIISGRKTDGIPKYLDLSPYYVEIPKIGDPQAEQVWKDLAKRVDSDQAVIDAYKQAVSIDGVVERLWFTQDSFLPFIYVELDVLSGDPSVSRKPRMVEFHPDSFLSDESIPLASVTESTEETKFLLRDDMFKADAGSHQIIVPLFPTVYPPFADLPGHQTFFSKIYGGKGLDLRKGHHSINIGPGAGIDRWIMSLVTGAEVDAIGANPVEVANTRAVGRIAGIKGKVLLGTSVLDGRGQPIFGYRYDRAVWGMPFYFPEAEPDTSVGQNIDLLRKSELPEYSAYDAGGRILNKFAPELANILIPGGRALIWNNPRYRSVVRRAFRKAGLQSYIQTQSDDTPLSGIFYIEKPAGFGVLAGSNFWSIFSPSVNPVTIWVAYRTLIFILREIAIFFDEVNFLKFVKSISYLYFPLHVGRNENGEWQIRPRDSLIKERQYIKDLARTGSKNALLELLRLIRNKPSDEARERKVYDALYDERRAAIQFLLQSKFSYAIRTDVNDWIENATNTLQENLQPFLEDFSDLGHVIDEYVAGAMLANAYDALVLRAYVQQEADYRGQIYFRIALSSKGKLSILIEDNGIGITPSILPNLLEKRFTSKTKDHLAAANLYTSDVFGGVGLGLFGASFFLRKKKALRISIESKDQDGHALRKTYIPNTKSEIVEIEKEEQGTRVRIDFEPRLKSFPAEDITLFEGRWAEESLEKYVTEHLPDHPKKNVFHEIASLHERRPLVWALTMLFYVHLWPFRFFWEGWFPGQRGGIKKMFEDIEQTTMADSAWAFKLAFLWFFPVLYAATHYLLARKSGKDHVADPARIKKFVSVTLPLGERWARHREDAFYRGHPSLFPGGKVSNTFIDNANSAYQLLMSRGYRHSQIQPVFEGILLEAVFLRSKGIAIDPEAILLIYADTETKDTDQLVRKYILNVNPQLKTLRTDEFKHEYLELVRALGDVMDESFVVYPIYKKMLERADSITTPSQVRDLFDEVRREVDLKIRSRSGFGVRVPVERESMAPYIDKVINQIKENEDLFKNEPKAKREMLRKVRAVRKLFSRGEDFAAAYELSHYAQATALRYQTTHERLMLEKLISLSKYLEMLSLPGVWKLRRWRASPPPATERFTDERAQAFNELLKTEYGLTLTDIVNEMSKTSDEELGLVPFAGHFRVNSDWDALINVIYGANKIDPKGRRGILRRLILNDLFVKKDLNQAGQSPRTWIYAIHHFAMKIKLESQRASENPPTGFGAEVKIEEVRAELAQAEEELRGLESYVARNDETPGAVTAGTLQLIDSKRAKVRELTQKIAEIEAGFGAKNREKLVAGLPESIARQITNPAVQIKHSEGFDEFGHGKDGVIIGDVSSSERVRNLVAEKIVKGLPAGSRLLSVGEGRGELAALLMSKGFKVSAVDISPENTAYALKRGVDQKIGSAYELPFQDGLFDAVIFSESIGTMNLSETLWEARRVLKPNGRIVITTYPAWDTEGADNPFKTKYLRYSMDEIKSALTAIGFRNYQNVPIRTSLNSASLDSPTILHFITARAAAGFGVVEDRERYDRVVTDPARHDPENFTYIVLDSTGIEELQENQIFHGSLIHRSKEGTADVLGLPAMQGFIVRVPDQHILWVSPISGYFEREERINRVRALRARFGLLSPKQLIWRSSVRQKFRRSFDHNNVMIDVRKASALKIEGVFFAEMEGAQISNGQPRFEINEGERERLRGIAKKNNFPVVNLKIPAPALPAPDEYLRVLQDDNHYFLPWIMSRAVARRFDRSLVQKQNHWAGQEKTASSVSPDEARRFIEQADLSGELEVTREWKSTWQGHFNLFRILFFSPDFLIYVNFKPGRRDAAIDNANVGRRWASESQTRTHVSKEEILDYLKDAVSVRILEFDRAESKLFFGNPRRRLIDRSFQIIPAMMKGRDRFIEDKRFQIGTGTLKERLAAAKSMYKVLNGPEFGNSVYEKGGGLIYDLERFFDESGLLDVDFAVQTPLAKHAQFLRLLEDYIEVLPSLEIQDMDPTQSPKIWRRNLKTILDYYIFHHLILLSGAIFVEWQRQENPDMTQIREDVRKLDELLKQLTQGPDAVHPFADHVVTLFILATSHQTRSERYYVLLEKFMEALGPDYLKAYAMRITTVLGMHLRVVFNANGDDQERQLRQLSINAVDFSMQLIMRHLLRDYAAVKDRPIDDPEKRLLVQKLLEGFSGFPEIWTDRKFVEAANPSLEIANIRASHPHPLQMDEQIESALFGKVYPGQFPEALDDFFKLLKENRADLARDFEKLGAPTTDTYSPLLPDASFAIQFERYIALASLFDPDSIEKLGFEDFLSADQAKSRAKLDLLKRMRLVISGLLSQVHQDRPHFDMVVREVSGFYGPTSDSAVQSYERTVAAFRDPSTHQPKWLFNHLNSESEKTAAAVPTGFGAIGISDGSSISETALLFAKQFGLKPHSRVLSIGTGDYNEPELALASLGHLVKVMDPYAGYDEVEDLPARLNPLGGKRKDEKLGRRIAQAGGKYEVIPKLFTQKTAAKHFKVNQFDLIIVANVSGLDVGPLARIIDSNGHLVMVSNRPDMVEKKKRTLRYRGLRWRTWKGLPYYTDNLPDFNRASNEPTWWIKDAKTYYLAIRDKVSSSGFGAVKKDELVGIENILKAVQPRAAVNISMVDSLATDVVFSIDAKTIQNLTSDKWKELLVLKALNQEKLHILIRYDRIEELVAPRVEELRNDFKNVRVGVWSNRLPQNAPVFYFSDPADSIHPSGRLDPQLVRRINGRYFGLLFGVALLYEFHEEKLPGLVNMNGYWNDPTGWYASEVLNLLFNSYVAVARAA